MPLLLLQFAGETASARSTIDESELVRLEKLEFGSRQTYFDEVVKLMKKASEENDSLGQSRVLMQFAKFLINRNYDRLALNILERATELCPQKEEVVAQAEITVHLLKC